MNNNNSTVKLITILDYIGILFILGFFVEKDNEDVKFHTNQGIILCICLLYTSPPRTGDRSGSFYHGSLGFSSSYCSHHMEYRTIIPRHHASAERMSRHDGADKCPRLGP